MTTPQKRYKIADTYYRQQIRQNRNDFIWFCAEIGLMAISLPVMVLLVQFL